MSTLGKFKNWIATFNYKHGCNPKVLPVTLVEFREVQRECGSMMTYVQERRAPEIMGLEAWITDKAEFVRVRQLEVPMSYVMAEYPVDECLSTQLEVMRTREGFKALRTMVLAEKTQVTVEFEWDCWAWIKRLFRLPAKKRTAVIDCSVLYLHCKVLLPHNRHTFQCRVDRLK
jgi:hypothetical protein